MGLNSQLPYQESHALPAEQFQHLPYYQWPAVCYMDFYPILLELQGNMLLVLSGRYIVNFYPAWNGMSAS